MNKTQQQKLCFTKLQENMKQKYYGAIELKHFIDEKNLGKRVLPFFTSLLNYVLSCPSCLVPRVLSFHTCLVPYVLSCHTCSPALLALAPYVLSHFTCLVPYMLSCPTCLVSCRAPRASCCMYSCASCVSCASCPTWSCASDSLCFRCLIPYVASCLALYELFFLTYPLVSYLAHCMS